MRKRIRKNKSSFVKFFCLALVLGIFSHFGLNCKKKISRIQTSDLPKIPIHAKLSQYGLFQNQNSEILNPIAKGLKYSLATPLFSDYTQKDRVIFLPDSKPMQYQEEDEFSMPVGTIISKTFSMPKDLRSPKQSLQRLETRLMIHQPDGWFGVSYIWKSDLSDAEISYEGKSIPISYVDKSGKAKQFVYSVPSRNQCGTCHHVFEEGVQTIVPIGIKARHLNRDYEFADAQTGKLNQLEFFQSKQVLTGLPLWGIPRNVDFADASQSLDARARSYLDSNCGHCHNPNAEAGINSKLILSNTPTDALSLGVCKTPGSAGKGGGGLKFDIVPKKPEESILLYRMQTTETGAMMPQLGRALVHEEAVALIREWILQMDEKDCK